MTTNVQSPAASGCGSIVKMGVAAAAIGGAACIGAPYAFAAAAFLGTVYLIDSCCSPSHKPAKLQGRAAPIAPSVPMVATTQQGGDWIARRMQSISSRSGIINFYDQTDRATEWLGNFYEAPIQFNGLTFRNSEAAFQAQKFVAYPQFMQQFTTLSGEQAYRLAKDNMTFIRSDWHQVKVQIMGDVLTAKVAQHPEIAEWLRATGSATLNEHKPVKGRDVFWSDDCDGSGQNMLGKLWMQIRSSLPPASGQALPSSPLAPLAQQQAPVARLASQTQKAASSCLVLSCSQPRHPGKLFCTLAHDQGFKEAYLQSRQQLGWEICDYPQCGKPRTPGFVYCSRTHGQIMEDWKRQYSII